LQRKEGLFDVARRSWATCKQGGGSFAVRPHQAPGWLQRCITFLIEEAAKRLGAGGLMGCRTGTSGFMTLSELAALSDATHTAAARAVVVGPAAGRAADGRV